MKMASPEIKTKLMITLIVSVGGMKVRGMTSTERIPGEGIPEDSPSSLTEGDRTPELLQMSVREEAQLGYTKLGLLYELTKNITK